MIVLMWLFLCICYWKCYCIPGLNLIQAFAWQQLHLHIPWGPHRAGARRMLALSKGYLPACDEFSLSLFPYLLCTGFQGPKKRITRDRGCCVNSVQSHIYHFG
jgi:hypothetical protein